MMKLSALLLLLCPLAAMGFDLEAYKQQYQSQVGAPYKYAVTVAAVNIVEFLANSPVPQTTAAAQQVVQQINAQTETLNVNLNIATQSSDAMRQQLDAELEQITAQASGVEQQLNANQQQLAQVNAQIVQTDAQLADAQNQVNAATQSVQNADNALRGEEERLRKARESCIGKRRRKRGWIKKIIRKVTKPVEKAICHVVNEGGIHNAKDAVNRARGDLAGQQQRLAQFQNQRAQLAQQQANLQQQRAGIEAQKAQLQATLAQLHQARDSVGTVNVQLKQIVTHLATLLGRSQVLADVVRNLIDMETVINPLNAVADQVISYTPNVDDVNYFNAMKQKIAASLPIIQQKLPQYALIPPA
jgi:chromosome segregation ATPase